MTPVVLTPDEAAAHLGVTKNYLAKLRLSGHGPTFERLTPRVIRYPVDQLNAWRMARRRTSTSDTGTAE